MQSDKSRCGNGWLAGIAVVAAGAPAGFSKPLRLPRNAASKAAVQRENSANGTRLILTCTRPSRPVPRRRT